MYAWASTKENDPFQRLAVAQTLENLSTSDLVDDRDAETLTAVEVIKAGSAQDPTQLLLHGLHGPGNRPSDWGPSDGARVINIGSDRFTAFTSHVCIWDDKIAAVDMHANSPGLGRLSTYIWRKAEGRVAFRPLYKQDAAARLNDLDGIRGVDFAIHDSHKMTEARKSGMIGSLLPKKKFPSISVSAGMSRKDPQDAYIDDELAAELFEVSDRAEQLFDRITIRGHSKTARTKTDKKKTVEVNLLSERLQVEKTLDSDTDNPSLPAQSQVLKALDSAKRSFAQSGELQDAAEARLGLDG